MEQRTLSRWLKGIVVGIGLCGLAVYLFVIPECGRTIVERYPEFAHWYRPWLGFLWATGIPCYAALALGWQGFCLNAPGKLRAFIG